MLWYFALFPVDDIPVEKLTPILDQRRYANLFLSIVIWFSAWIHVPLSIVHFGNSEKSMWTNKWKGGFALYFLVQALIVLAAMIFFGEVYTRTGPNGHQIWPCTPALHRLETHIVGKDHSFYDEIVNYGQYNSKDEDNANSGGAQGSIRSQPSEEFRSQKSRDLWSLGDRSQMPEFHEDVHKKNLRKKNGAHEPLALHWLHLCTLVCILYALLAQISLKNLPMPEFFGFGLPGAVSYFAIYYSLGETMEACSTWCWMAGIYSVFFLFRPHITKSVDRLCGKAAGP